MVWSYCELIGCINVDLKGIVKVYACQKTTDDLDTSVKTHRIPREHNELKVKHNTLESDLSSHRWKMPY